MKHKSVYVPYTDRACRLPARSSGASTFVDEEGVPSVILMQNHGLIVMGNTRAVASATDMTEKRRRSLWARMPWAARIFVRRKTLSASSRGPTRPTA